MFAFFRDFYAIIKNFSSSRGSISISPPKEEATMTRVGWIMDDS